MVKKTRCTWCGNDPLYVRYHDLEWGVPTRDRNALFELLVLEGLQAGLSWLTVLRKRRRIRAAMFALCPELVARMGPLDRSRLLSDPGVIRHRGKLEAISDNARRFLELDRNGSAVEFLWSFVGDRPVVNRWKQSDEIPGTTVEAHQMSRELRAKGFKFVGPTICYAFMQASGMVNDHLTSCYRYESCRETGARRCVVA